MQVIDMHPKIPKNGGGRGIYWFMKLESRGIVA